MHCHSDFLYYRPRFYFSINYELKDFKNIDDIITKAIRNSSAVARDVEAERRAERRREAGWAARTQGKKNGARRRREDHLRRAVHARRVRSAYLKWYVAPTCTKRPM
ncbi:protein of unknown function [Pararobbsia alpina]